MEAHVGPSEVGVRHSACFDSMHALQCLQRHNVCGRRGEMHETIWPSWLPSVCQRTGRENACGVGLTDKPGLLQRKARLLHLLDAGRKRANPTPRSLRAADEDDDRKG